MKLTYQVTDKPKFGQVLIFALQQLLAILAATIAVPAIINSNMGTSMSASAALFGAGVGTLVYLLFTRFKSPVFLGSSFAFLGSMMAAFAGGVSMSLGYFGLILGAAFAGLVYVVLSLIVKIAGVNWINKLMPAVIIGPTVAIIGLSLAGNAVGDLFVGKVGYVDEENNFISTASPYLCIICGLVTLFVTMACSVYGKKMMKMIPFIIGICAGYVLAAVFTVIGGAYDITALKIIDFSAFSNMQWYPDFTFIKAFFGEAFEYGDVGSMGGYIITILVAYVPVAFVVFAEHIADHKNLSSIIEKDLLKDPGLHNTLLGDGVGSMVG
ncbi:MAG: uracil-xanthine permease, partial [Lachnospiraceae bacterium]|nr:uracil-xanthine permease [Lachnospiraceae bacterium]